MDELLEVDLDIVYFNTLDELSRWDGRESEMPVEIRARLRENLKLLRENDMEVTVPKEIAYFVTQKGTVSFVDGEIHGVDVPKYFIANGLRRRTEGNEKEYFETALPYRLNVDPKRIRRTIAYFPLKL